MMRKALALVMVCGLIAGCADAGYTSRGGQVSKADVGTLLGGVGGAVAGAQFGKGSGRYAAIAAGTLLGAGLGRTLGGSLDKVDTMYHEQTAQQVFETGRSGQTLAWNNPDTGHSGTVTPVNVIERGAGQYCREFRQTISVGGKSEEGYGTACRQPDGSWKIVQ